MLYHFLFGPPVSPHAGRRGEDDEAEMDRRKVTFFFFLTVLAPSGLQLIRQKKQKTKKNKERTDVYEYCLSVFRPGSFCLRTSI